MIAWAGRPGGLGEETRPALRVAGPSWRAGGRLPPRSAGALHWPIPGASVMAKHDATGYADVFVGVILPGCAMSRCGIMMALAGAAAAWWAAPLAVTHAAQAS